MRSEHLFNVVWKELSPGKEYRAIFEVLFES